MALARLLVVTVVIAVTASPSLCAFPEVLGGSSLGLSFKDQAFLPGPSQSYQSPALLQPAQQPSSHGQPLQVIFEWNALDYNLPRYPTSRIEAYDPLGSIFTGLEFTADRYFVAVPRLFPGVPSTLNFIPRNAAGLVANPKLEPFPSIEWQSPTGADGELANCSQLISVYRVKVDRCNRLWVVDAGVVNSETVVCTPKLIAFDLTTGQAVRSMLFPQSVLKSGSLLTNIILDDEDSLRTGHCDNIFFYFNDDHDPAIIVYDLAKDLVRRVSDLTMYPDPDFGNYETAGEKYKLMDGIIGMALSPVNTLGGRILYYQPMSQNNIYSVPTAALRDFAAGDEQELPVKLVGTKSSQGIGLAIDKDSTLYFSPLTEIALGSYNTATRQHRTIVVDRERLQSVTDLQVDPADDSLYVFSTRFQKYVAGTVNLNEINMRMIRFPREVLYPRGVEALGGIKQPLGNYHKIYARSTNATVV
ncbi:major royal jelly protein 1-like [Ischnura elegans]|uniref:major royal jelly protein 1-like n=1 Tax=Ischnura elegans TaxID=197161 RepID=UPI001ED893E0|nr:major royal jelly protein 1-like [Ischnura elegans]XP_046389432.1 major royal jelly protein 1-like [Ischnura elegans]